MNNSKKGKFQYGVLDKLMGGYQVSFDDYFDTITECVAAIIAQDDEGNYSNVVLRLQYRHKDLCVY